MKTKLTQLVLFAISAGFFLISCAEQDNVISELELGTVDFSIQENTAKTSSKKGSKLAAKTNSLEQVSKAIITIIGTDGSPTDFTNAALDVYRLNGSLFVQKLALPVGDYQLSAFSFTDESNTIIYVTPELGSDLADLVVAPLSIDFSVGNGTAAAVDVEVVSTETYTPADFGLVSFPVVEVQTLDFLLAVSELGANEILAGEYAIATTGFSTTKSFTAIEENVLTVRDIENAVYSLTINVAGYEEFTTEITRDDIINIYHQRPLVIELAKTMDLFSTVFEENTNAPLCLGGAGQSFTVNESFTWTVLELQSCSGEQTGTLTIYDGSGTGGAVLLSQSIHLNDGINQIYLNTPISCSAGNIYTLSTNLALSYSFGGDPYPGGVSYSGGNPFVADRDIYFKIGN